MHQIYIEHNPFTVETLFLIDGKEPDENSTLHSYKQSRLQTWVEGFFDDLREAHNGETEFDVEFKGFTVDFQDLAEAAETARNNGMTINLCHIQVEENKDRLNALLKLVKDMKKDPQIKKYIEDNKEISKCLDDLNDPDNKDFNLYVVATMSSGKSTLINAMLGQELLPAANEATTATIAQITDDKTLGSSFKAQRISSDGKKGEEVDATVDLIKMWNKEGNQKDNNIQQIELRGNIISMQQRDNVRLVLTDTPGPNNSQTDIHELATMNYIKDSKKNPLILYILNGTQLGTNDDKNLLGLVAEAMEKGGKQSKDRFIFVANKMDDFDPEKEDISAALDNVRNYLKDNGIQNPQVYPVSAHAALMLRKKANNHPMTTDDKIALSGYEVKFKELEDMDFINYIPRKERIRAILKERFDFKNDLHLIEARSGLPAVEVMIDEYISKYKYPDQVKCAYNILDESVKKGLLGDMSILGLDELDEKIKIDEGKLEKIKEGIDQLDRRSKDRAAVDAYKQKFLNKKIELPKNIADELNKHRSEVRKVIKEQSNEFSGKEAKEASPREAKAMLKSAEKDIKFLFNKLINDCSRAFQGSEEILRKELHKEYEQYVAYLFGDNTLLELPELQSIRDNIGNFSLNLELKVTEQDIQTEEIEYNHREVSASTWWKPWTWGDTYTEYDTRTEERVNVAEIWKRSRTDLEGNFNELLDKAQQILERDKNELVKKYINFIDNEFNAKFNDVVNKMKARTKDKEAMEDAIKESKKLKTRISDFEQCVKKILSL